MEAFLARWGLLAVFLGCFFEGETAAILGGVVSHRGLLQWLTTASIAALGAVLADQMYFLLGRYTPKNPRIGAWISRLRQRAQNSWMQGWLDRHADLAALSFRFIPGTRILGPVLLAQTRMSWRRYTLLNTASTLFWAVFFTAIGYHFGRAAELWLGRLHGHHFLLLLGSLLVLLLGLHLALRHWAKTRASRKIPGTKASGSDGE